MANVLRADKKIAKTGKPGRPPLPKGSTKGKMLRIRVTSDELRTIKAAAKTSGQTRSEFIRGKLLATTKD